MDDGFLIGLIFASFLFLLVVCLWNGSLNKNTIWPVFASSFAGFGVLILVLALVDYFKVLPEITLTTFLIIPFIVIFVFFSASKKIKADGLTKKVLLYAFSMSLVFIWILLSVVVLLSWNYSDNRYLIIVFAIFVFFGLCKLFIKKSEK